MLQLAANGKIYCSTWNGIIGFDSIHVINDPDAKGDSCHFVYGGQPILNNNGLYLPSMINYRLGPLVGSGCDTIASIEPGTKKQELRILPNPADKYIYVEMGMQGDYEFDLLNEDGRVMASRQTRQVDNFDTERLSAGIYYLRVLNKTSNSSITKEIAIIH
jgi:hypothetical protein